MNLHHLGYGHLEFFRDQILPLISNLPRGFRALEVGAGMGWHAALLAAHGAGHVLATEVLWSDDTPFGLANVHTLYRLAERESVLEAALRFDRDDDGHLRAVRFPPALSFVRSGAECLPVADASLDFLYSYNCLEHLHDLDGAFLETARVLRRGGLCYAATEPLFYSVEGHHLGDLFAIPWGHLLWEPESLADLVVREAGEGREWGPGEPVTAGRAIKVLREDLNGAAPADLRRALRPGPWALEGWVDLTLEDDERLAREIGLRDALRGIPAEALFLRGVRFRLRRVERPRGLRAPFRLSHRARRILRPWRPRSSFPGNVGGR